MRTFTYNDALHSIGSESPAVRFRGDEDRERERERMALEIRRVVTSRTTTSYKAKHDRFMYFLYQPATYSGGAGLNTSPTVGSITVYLARASSALISVFGGPRDFSIVSRKEIWGKKRRSCGPSTARSLGVAENSILTREGNISMKIHAETRIPDTCAPLRPTWVDRHPPTSV